MAADPDRGDEMSIRGVEPADLDRLYEICLRTGAAGQDASGIIEDPKLLGHLFVAPYAVLEPDLSFVVVDDDGVGGYVVGTADTAAFEERLAAEWLPSLQRQYPLGSGGEGFDSLLVALLHHQVRAPAALLEDYPAHLHIDLLPRLQGRGLGRGLLDTLTDALRRRGASGVHFGVHPTNTRALAFYRHLGYTELDADSVTVTMGQRW